MANQYFQKPENALKRANELGAIGNKQAALQVLHDMLTAKKSKTWQLVFETIMFKYIDLCVDMQTYRHAKDGLHQYRNIAQQQAPSSLENVINYLLEAAEKRVAEAASTANDGSVLVKDLDNMTTPESVLMATMTDDGEQERAEREVLVPWLKFCWETYRSVLDILKTNSKLERVYHATACRAFDFCRKYERRTELRRLCDMLRVHFSNLQKAGSTPNFNSSRLRGWEGWTQESIEMHLATRFAQLEAASGLELWTEGFRTVEDIYSIARISIKAPKPKLMARYYERLTKIFWVSDNLLFHAYAWSRHFQLTKELTKPLSDEERASRACCVVLAALAIPDKAGCGSYFSDGDAAGGEAAVQQAALASAGGLASALPSTGAGDDEFDGEKNARMALLLGFATHPSRAALLADVQKAGLLDLALPCVRVLHEALEQKFEPLQLAQTVKPLLDELRSHPRLAQYALPLERLAAARLVRQLSVVYRVVHLDAFKALLEQLGPMTHGDVEKLVVGAAHEAGGAVARLDYRQRCLRFAETPSRSENRARRVAEGAAAMAPKRTAYFGADRARAGYDATEAALDELRAHLSLARRAADSAERRGASAPGAEASAGAARAADRAVDRAAFFARCREQSDLEHAKALSRKAVIERRKEEYEHVQLEKTKADAAEKLALEEERKRDEAKRLDREARDREREKVSKMKAELALQEAREVMKSLGKVDVGESFEDLAQDERQKVIEATKEAAVKERRAEELRLAEQARRLDYITRALRLEELPILADRYAQQVDRDRAEAASDNERAAAAERARHAADVVERARVAPVQPHVAAFVAEVSGERRAAWEATQRDRRAAWDADRHARKVARARRRMEEAEEKEENRLAEEEDEEARREDEAAAAEERAADEAERAERASEEAAMAVERAAQKVIDDKANAEAREKRLIEQAAAKKAVDEERAAQREKETADLRAREAERDKTSGQWKRGPAAPAPAAAPATGGRTPLAMAPRSAAATGAAAPRFSDDGGSWRRGGADTGAAPAQRQAPRAAPDGGDAPRRRFDDKPADAIADGGKWKRGGATSAAPAVPRPADDKSGAAGAGAGAPGGKWR
ncbi:hypothetical protein M885DRAFT_546895 [Pelagophyceae sp. CCMP2097]|nr:hypothetical protein M885DRAFT_546895 [Pelagophyceae sp. CCMP2097]